MQCSNMLFTMSADIYYSSENQDDFGVEVKDWQLDQTVDCYFEILGAVDKDSIKGGEFYEYNDKLIGRSKTDIRESVNGLYYPITSILITDIRDRKTCKHFYTESSGERSSKSTIYEVMAVEPYVNPWNQIEYYKILLNRSDRQEIDND